MASVEELQHLLGGSSDDGALPAHDDRSLHQFRMGQQHVDDLLARLVVGLGEAQFGEVLVLAHQVRRRARETIDQPLEDGS
jgi:UDP-N-acetylenolpyruvoylglucosamine reductase